MLSDICAPFTAEAADLDHPQAGPGGFAAALRERLRLARTYLTASMEPARWRWTSFICASLALGASHDTNPSEAELAPRSGLTTAKIYGLLDTDDSVQESWVGQTPYSTQSG